MWLVPRWGGRAGGGARVGINEISGGGGRRRGGGCGGGAHAGSSGSRGGRGGGGKGGVSGHHDTRCARQGAGGRP